MFGMLVCPHCKAHVNVPKTPDGMYRCNRCTQAFSIEEAYDAEYQSEVAGHSTRLIPPAELVDYRRQLLAQRPETI